MLDCSRGGSGIPRAVRRPSTATWILVSRPRKGRTLWGASLVHIVCAGWQGLRCQKRQGQRTRRPPTVACKRPTACTAGGALSLVAHERRRLNGWVTRAQVVAVGADAFGPSAARPANALAARCVRRPGAAFHASLRSLCPHLRVRELDVLSLSLPLMTCMPGCCCARGRGTVKHIATSASIAEGLNSASLRWWPGCTLHRRPDLTPRARRRWGARGRQQRRTPLKMHRRGQDRCGAD